MDADRFDRIAKTMVTSGSRRRVLGALLGALLGTAVVGPAGETLAAPGKRHGKKSEKASRRKPDDRQPGDRKRTERAKSGHKPPTPDRTAEPTQDVASQEVGIAAHGCRHTGANCTRPGQCCSGRCAGNGTCQLCSRAAQCPSPPASQPCKQRVCTSAGKCVIKNKAADAACTSDNNECTDDVCNASGECTHPNKTNGATCTTCQESTCTCQDGTCTPEAAPCDAQSCPGCCDGTTCKGGDADGACGSNGEGCISCDFGQRCAGGTCVCDGESCAGCCDGTTCRGGGTRGACGSGGDACQVCASSETCSDGACVCGGACVCPALKENCTNAEECTEGCEGAVACGPIGNLGQGQCCRPLGAPCSNPGQFDECCAVVFQGGGGDLVTCGPNNTCGGPGAQCHSSDTCASGVCCGFPGIEEVCCAAGQQCQDFACTG